MQGLGPAACRAGPGVAGCNHGAAKGPKARRHGAQRSLATRALNLAVAGAETASSATRLSGSSAKAIGGHRRGAWSNGPRALAGFANSEQQRITPAVQAASRFIQ
jgi:hypothetical protein